MSTEGLERESFGRAAAQVQDEAPNLLPAPIR
jgi:hypothetical protein